MLLPTSLTAQTTARVRTAENLRQTPNGTILGRLGPGTPLTVVARKGSWMEIDFEGWMWTRSLQKIDQDGFDLVVSASGGENLRAGPSGERLGHLVRGALLQEVERRPGWLRVRRRAWIWAASVTVAAAPKPAAATQPNRPEQDSAEDPAPGPDTVPGGGDAAANPRGFLRIGSHGAAILTSEKGDTVAMGRPGAELEVLSRDGQWARVRIEGWTRLGADDTVRAGPTAVDTTLTPADLTRDPTAYHGRLVAWTLRFIGLEHAEKVRTDFFEGEPYLLTRFGDAGGPFVYVAVPSGKISEVEGLAPLEKLKVTGRVRTGASALTGTPIIDLLTLKHVKGDG